MIVLVQAVMTAATLCFAFGYAQRIRNNALHRRWMATGIVLTAGIAVVLVIGVHVFGATYGPSPWLVDLLGSEGAAWRVLRAHRVLASVTFLVLAAQGVTGWRRHPLHRRLWRLAVPLWIASYGSGMIIFQ